MSLTWFGGAAPSPNMLMGSKSIPNAYKSTKSIPKLYGTALPSFGRPTVVLPVGQTIHSMDYQIITNYNKIISFLPKETIEIDQNEQEISTQIPPNIDIQSIPSDQPSKSKEKQYLERAKENLIPAESKGVYTKHFKKYKDFIDEFAMEISEETIMMWFECMRDDEAAPSSMYTYYSAIKNILVAQFNINPNGWEQAKKWLKNYKDGKERKKRPVFKSEDAVNFLANADDDEYENEKISFITGIGGCFRARWITHRFIIKKRIISKSNNICENIKIQIKKAKKVIHFWHYKKKSKVYKNFMVTDKVSVQRIFHYIKKTKKLWTNKQHKYGSRFLWRKKRKKGTSKWVFTGRPLGIGWFYAYPKKIAKWLGLAEWWRYSGHCVRGTSASFFCEGDNVSLLQLKKFGCWKSDAVAESYYDNAVLNKEKDADIINLSIGMDEKEETEQKQEEKNGFKAIEMDGKRFTNCSFTNCTFSNCAL